ncbi:MAG: hypothetical protein PHN69_02430 [Candidatus Pacebacteria bacterium]|nr:hypothetical protein [Candidatus Paceibacterota bacterium]
MAITKKNYKNNLTRTLFYLIKEELGTTYTNTDLGNLPITYVSVYPSDFKAYADKLPLIIIEEGGRDGSELMELGGRSIYRDSYTIYVVAGGYKEDYHNTFLKNALTDDIYFLFDKKTYDFKNYDTETNGNVEGTIKIAVELANSAQTDKISEFSRHRDRLRLSVETLIYN